MAELAKNTTEFLPQYITHFLIDCHTFDLQRTDLVIKLSFNSANNLNYKETSHKFIAGERKKNKKTTTYGIVLILQNVLRTENAELIKLVTQFI
jgi:hypothetical protein